MNVNLASNPIIFGFAVGDLKFLIRNYILLVRGDPKLVTVTIYIRFIFDRLEIRRWIVGTDQPGVYFNQYNIFVHVVTF